MSGNVSKEFVELTWIYIWNYVYIFCKMGCFWEIDRV